MKLTEILHTVENEKKKGLINIDDWKWNDASYLEAMGFTFDGDYNMSLRDPSMRIYKKKGENGGEYFYLEDASQGVKIFKTFDEVIHFFDQYSQPEIDKEKQ